MTIKYKTYEIPEEIFGEMEVELDSVAADIMPDSDKWMASLTEEQVIDNWLSYRELTIEEVLAKGYIY